MGVQFQWAPSRLINRAPSNQVITCKSSKLLVGSIVGSEGDRLYGLFQTAYWPLGLCCLPFVGCHFFATCLLCRVHDLAQCGDDVDHGGDDDDDGDDGDDYGGGCDDGDDDDSGDGGDEGHQSVNGKKKKVNHQREYAYYDYDDDDDDYQ